MSNANKHTRHVTIMLTNKYAKCNGDVQAYKQACDFIQSCHNTWSKHVRQPKHVTTHKYATTHKVSMQQHANYGLKLIWAALY